MTIGWKYDEIVFIAVMFNPQSAVTRNRRAENRCPVDVARTADDDIKISNSKGFP
jgi:hypothetical protein